MDATKKRHRRVAGIIFIAYLIVLFYFLFFSEEMGRSFAQRDYQYNLQPFREIMRFIRYRRIFGTQVVLMNLLGNVLAFVPYGAFLPFFSKRCRRFWRTACYSFDLSLLVEVSQLASRAGSFDVDDLLLNTLGGMLGYLVFRFLWNREQCRE